MEEDNKFWVGTKGSVFPWSGPVIVSSALSVIIAVLSMCFAVLLLFAP